MTSNTEIVQALRLTEKAALLSGANTWESRSIERAGVPSMWFADGPHGVRRQAGSADHLGINASEEATCFPTAATIANSWNLSLAEDVAAAIGMEASSQGVHVLLGPGMNIKRSPLGGRGFEYFSEDPELTGRLAAAYVRGIQSTGVAATPKHFAVNSQETRRMVSDSVIDERTMREIYLTAFEIAVRESGPWALMSAYNLINGEYAHEHRHLLIDVLREEWGFTGAVISDWGGSNDAVTAVQNGGTLEMPSPGFDSARQLVDAVQKGDLAETDIDARVKEILDLASHVSEVTASAVDLERHHALARRAAAESTVLLRNEEALLPLRAGTTIAVIGEFAEFPRIQGAGSSLVNPTRVTTLLGSIKNTDLTMTSYARGYRRDGVRDAALVEEAVAAARKADVVILALGQPESAESEGLDRSSLALPADQVALLSAVSKVNKNTVVLLSAGGVITMPWLEDVGAVLHGYLGGQGGAEGLLDVVTGVVSPAGRLAETFPLSLADTPTATHFPSEARTAEYREGLFVGYRYYISADVPVAFPFGFGLSYTTFEYTDLAVEDNVARFTVTNTGRTAGTDVPQIYIGRDGGSVVHRPTRELKAWARVHLLPGESTRVRVELGERAFRFWDVRSGAWETESGNYRIEVGPNARDVVLEARREVNGTVAAGELPRRLRRYGRANVRAVPDSDFEALLGRPVPDAGWQDGALGENDPIGRLGEARSRLARVLFRVAESRKRRAEREGAPDLNLLFLFNGPFRIISKMSGGLATREVTDAVLIAVNGQPLRGVLRAAVAFVKGRRAERRSSREFQAAASAREGKS